MKNKITLFFAGIFSLSSFAQDKMYDLLKNKTQTNILYDRVYNISNATNPKIENVTTNDFLQTYHEIQRADFQNRLPKLETLKEEGNLGFAKKQIPLSILISDFEIIKKQAIDDNVVFLNRNNQMELTSNSTDVFEKHILNNIGALLSKSKSNTVEFILKDNLIFNTTERKIISISYNFKEEKNWNIININKPFSHTFEKKGPQVIKFKLELSDGETIEQSILIEIENQNIGINAKNSNSYLTPNIINSIESTIAYQGYDESQAYKGQGEYEIFLDTVDGILDKPIFLLDGFDPGDLRNITSIYSLLNYGISGQNLADDLRALGYDIIILNFPTYTRTGTTTVIDGGVDYIQRNAMVLIELINQINGQKTGTEKNVIIGPSMGGLISRYAIRYMEINSMNPDTRLYISFDSPHLGANVPIGFQHLFNYMAYGPLGNVAVQAIVDGMLKSPAAKEMLIDHFQGHLQSGSTTEFNTNASSLFPFGAPNFRNTFQNELNTMGFPVTTRNVSISNGAGNGTMTGTPGMTVMNHTFDISSTQRAIINLNFTPAVNQNIEVSHFKGQQWILFWFTVYESLAKSKSPTYTDGLDSAPGGRYDMSSLSTVASGNALLTEFFSNLQIMYFDFIPVWSSMAISNTNNLYAPITSTSVTPFVAFSIPTTNENHVTLTAQNMAFALNEILNPVLNSNENNALNTIWIKNPFENILQINSSYPIEKTTVSLTDVLGKTILNIDNQIINGSLEIPVSISKGIYLLTIKNEKEKIIKKIIKN